MINSYPFDSITLNGRTIDLHDILAGTAPHSTEFEKETLEFLREWLRGTEQFTVHTSGSTGTPKPIQFTRAQMEQSARATINALKLPANETAVVCLHTRYIAGKMMIVRAILNSMRIVAVEPSSNPLEQVGDDEHISFMAVVPLQLQTMINHGLLARRGKIDTILIGGAALSPELRAQSRQLKSRVFASYGMTETITHIALQEITAQGDNEAFTTLPGIGISRDERNCLVIHADFLPEPVVTNDIVEISGHNSFRWLGRFDNVINTGGIKVIPEQLERVIGQVLIGLGIAGRFFVTGQPDERLGNKVVLFMEGTRLSRETELDILKKIREHVSPYETPREIQYAHTFVMTETGKINTRETVRRISSL